MMKENDAKHRIELIASVRAILALTSPHQVIIWAGQLEPSNFCTLTPAWQTVAKKTDSNYTRCVL